MKTFILAPVILLSTATFAQNLPYPCKEALRRQSSKPATFEKELQYYRSLTGSGQTNFMLEDGLGLTPKIEASLSDLSKNNCPTSHPEVTQITSALEKQKAEIPEIYNKLKSLKDNQSKLANTSNYPDVDKDMATLEYLFGKYNNLESMFQNLNYTWIENKVTAQINIKNPVMDMKRLKEILTDMYNDGDIYNAIAKKYQDLIKNNPSIANRFGTYGNPVVKNLSNLYTTLLPWIHENFPQAINMNFKVIEATAKEAVEKKNPVIFKAAILTPMELNSQLINLLSLAGKKGAEIAGGHKAEFLKTQKKISEMEISLGEQLLKDQRLGAEKYVGADKEAIRTEVMNKFKELHPGKNLIKIQMVNEAFDRLSRWDWNGQSWYKTDYSDLGFYAVVKVNDKVAELVGGWLRVNHMKQDKRSIWFEFATEKDLQQNRKILISNL